MLWINTALLTICLLLRYFNNHIILDVYDNQHLSLSKRWPCSIETENMSSV